MVGTFVAVVPDGFDDGKLVRPDMCVDFFFPLRFLVRSTPRQVPDPVHDSGPVPGHPIDGRPGVTGLALYDYEHERAGNSVTNHQAYDADVAEQKRYELPEVVLALLRPRFFSFVVVPSATSLPFHSGGRFQPSSGRHNSRKPLTRSLGKAATRFRGSL